MGRWELFGGFRCGDLVMRGCDRRLPLIRLTQRPKLHFAVALMRISHGEVFDQCNTERKHPIMNAFANVNGGKPMSRLWAYS